MAQKPKAPPSSAPSSHPLDAHRALLGRVPDSVVAETAGVALDEVKAYRKTHSLKPFLGRPPVARQTALPMQTAPAADPTTPAPVIRRRSGEEGQVRARVQPATPPAVEPQAAPVAKAAAAKAAAAATAPAAKAAAAKAPAAKATAAKAPEVAAPAEQPPVVAAAAPAAADEHPLAKFRSMLGQVSDDQIALLAGVRRQAVGEYRRRAGVASYDGFRFGNSARTGTEAGPTAVVAAAPAKVAKVAKAAPAVEVAAAPAEVAKAAPAEVAKAAPAEVAKPAPAAEVPPVAAAPATVAAPPKTLDLEKFRSRLGKESDGAIAAEGGVDRKVIGEFRRQLGLPSYRGHWGQEAGEPSGAAAKTAAPAAKTAAPAAKTAAPAAKTAAPTAKSVPAAAEAASAAPADEPKFRRGKLDAFAHLMGNVPDAEIAAMAKATPSGVKAHRTRHGIAAPPRAGVEVAAPEPEVTPTRRPSKLDAFRHIVGVLSDSAVAKQTQMTSEAVRQYRKREGILSGAQRALAEAQAPVAAAPVAAAPVAAAPVAAAPVAAAPVAAAPVAAARASVSKPAAAAPARALRGFLVVAEAGTQVEKFVVIGANIGLAAMAAVEGLANRAGGPWHVRSVKDVAEAIT